MHVAICSFIPHRVAPQQSSAMLQTAGTNIMLSIDLNKEKDKILSLQFDLYATKKLPHSRGAWELYHKPKKVKFGITCGDPKP